MKEKKLNWWICIGHLGFYSAVAFIKGIDSFLWFLIGGAIVSVILGFLFQKIRKNQDIRLHGLSEVVFIIGYLGIIALWIYKDLFLLIPLFGFPLIALLSSWINRMQNDKETKCNGCGEKGAMEVYNTKRTGSEQISITKYEEITDVYGEKHQNRYYVPGTRYYYRDYRRCKYCGYEDYVNGYWEEEN